VIRIQAAASLAAGVVLAMVIVSAVYRVVLIRLYVKRSYVTVKDREDNEIKSVV
jgi:hypothetical protein